MNRFGAKFGNYAYHGDRSLEDARGRGMAEGKELGEVRFSILASVR